MLRVAIDTNVAVSAFIADGPPSRLIELAVDGRIALLVPEPVLDELARVLRGKFGLPARQVAEIDVLLRGLAVETPGVPAEVEEVSGDPSDDAILASAASAGAEVLVSGDRRHVLPLGEYRGMSLVRPQDLLAELS